LRTLGGPLVALLLQAQNGEALDGNSTSSIANLLAVPTWVGRSVLLILALLSVASWAVILFKLWAFARAERQSRSFLDVFRRSNKFSEVQAVCRSLEHSPLVGLFQSGYAELTAQLRQAPPGESAAAPNSPASNPRPPSGRPTLKSVSAVDRALMRASIVEMNKLERRVPFLATTASVAPFIGLFGTVWGILTAFMDIGQTGSTNLAVVGPAIGEALITTAAGLFAAIPAVWAYNMLTLRVKVFASEMDDFAMEFLNIAERNFT
jgi:biopolymer transport protein TolQ